MNDQQNNRPALGTTEAGVLGFVHLLSYQLEVTEEYLAYWLDAYYQLRRAYEQEHAPEPDSTVLRRSDLEPVIRKLWDETLDKRYRAEAAKRMAERKAAEPAKIEGETLAGFEPVSASKEAPAAAAAYKRAQKARLEELRKGGIGLGAIAAASGGMVTEGLLMDILDAKRVAIADYRLVEAAMAAAEKAAAQK